MTNNHHAVGVIGGIASPSVGSQAPSMAMGFQKGQGSKNSSGMAGILPQNKPIQGQHIPNNQGNFINRKKIST